MKSSIWVRFHCKYVMFWGQTPTSNSDPPKTSHVYHEIVASPLRSCVCGPSRVLSRTRVCPALASPARTHACEVHTHTPTPTQVSLSVSPSAWVHSRHHHPAGTLLFSLQVGQFVLVCVRASRRLGPPGLRFLSSVKARASISWARSPHL